MRKIFLFSLLFVFIFIQYGFCQSIEVVNPVIYATPPKAKNGGAFMEIKNLSDKEISLISASNTASKYTEIHTHIEENGMKKMVQIPELKIAPKSTAVLKRGGDHIMLIELQKPLKAGGTVDITLKFSNNETINVKNIKVVKK